MLTGFVRFLHISCVCVCVRARASSVPDGCVVVLQRAHARIFLLQDIRERMERR